MWWSQWLNNNIFDLVQTAGIVLGFLVTLHAVREETKSRKVSNAIALTQNHRELWTLPIQNPSLARVLDREADVKKTPPTRT